MSTIEKIEEQLRQDAYEQGKSDAVNELAEQYVDKNKIELVAKLFKKELDEEFYINYEYPAEHQDKRAKFVKEGLLVFDEYYGEWINDIDWLFILIIGKARIVRCVNNAY